MRNQVQNLAGNNPRAHKSLARSASAIQALDQTVQSGKKIVEEARAFVAQIDAATSDLNRAIKVFETAVKGRSMLRQSSEGAPISRKRTAPARSEMLCDATPYRIAMLDLLSRNFGTTCSQLEKQCGINENQLRRLISGGQRSLTQKNADRLNKLFKARGISIEKTPVEVAKILKWESENSNGQAPYNTFTRAAPYRRAISEYLKKNPEVSMNDVAHEVKGNANHLYRLRSSTQYGIAPRLARRLDRFFEKRGIVVKNNS